MDWREQNIIDASKNASKIFSIYLATVAYVLLTSLSISDKQILFQDQVHLPIFNVSVPLRPFLICAPLILISSFLYLQLYIFRIKALIIEMRKKDSKLEQRRLYPWLVVIAEDHEPGVIGKLQKGIVSMLLWSPIPLVLNIQSIIFVRMHDEGLSYASCLFSILSTVLIVFFWKKYDAVRVMEKPNKTRLKTFFSKHSSSIFFLQVIISIQLFMIVVVIPVSMMGRYDLLRLPELNLSKLFFLDVGYQKLVTEPTYDYKTIYWLDLNKRHLEGINLTASILKRTDLRGAQLQYSILERVDLDDADAHGANLEGAFLRGASLRNIDLGESKLQDANFWFAHLDSAYLREASLTSASFERADLVGADLTDCNLTHAVLKLANLNKSKFVLTRAFFSNLFHVSLDSADMTESNLSRSELGWSSMIGAKLNKAKLIWSHLIKVNFEGADLDGTVLDNSYLAGANFLKAKNLKIEQLSRVFTLFGAQIDTPLGVELKKTYPQLFILPSVSVQHIWFDSLQKSVPNSESISYGERLRHPYLDPPIEEIIADSIYQQKMSDSSRKIYH